MAEGSGFRLGQVTKSSRSFTRDRSVYCSGRKSDQPVPVEAPVRRRCVTVGCSNFLRVGRPKKDEHCSSCEERIRAAVLYGTEVVYATSSNGTGVHTASMTKRFSLSPPKEKTA